MAEEPTVTFASVKETQASMGWRAFGRFFMLMGRIVAKIPLLNKITGALLSKAVPWVKVHDLRRKGNLREAFTLCCDLCSHTSEAHRFWLLMYDLAIIVRMGRNAEMLEDAMECARNTSHPWVGLQASMAARLLSRAAFDLTRKDEARTYAVKAYEADPSCPDSAAWLAWFKLNEGDPDAETFLEEAAESRSGLRKIVREDPAFADSPIVRRVLERRG